ETSIVRSAPRRATSEPAGIPKTPTGISSAARTQPIFAVDPVVTSTNHGSATKVIAEPVSDTSSALMTAASERFRRMLTATNIKRLYGFVKCDRAEGLRGARPGPPRPDPGR